MTADMTRARAADLSRVTVVGDRRRVDLVLPSGEPVGRLMPDLLRLLDDPVSSPPELRHLITADGIVLPPEGTLAAAAIPDGAVLRLVRTQDAPPAPVVHDVTDEVTDDLDLRAWRWRPAAWRWTATVATLALALVAGVLARENFSQSTVDVWLAVVAALLVTSGGAAAGVGSEELGTALVLTGGALGVLAVWTAADTQDWSAAARWAALGGVAVLLLVLLGLLSPVGRGGLVGATALVFGAVGWEVTAALLDGARTGSERARLGVVLAVASVVALGLLPRFALVTAGLAGLDDRRTGGATVSRQEVATALAAAHRGLVVATAVTGGSAAAAGWLAVTVPDRWTVPLAIVLGLVLAARARAYPLVAEVVVLLGAAAVVLVRLVGAWTARTDGSPLWPLAVLCAVAALVLGSLVLHPPEHVRVRLRRIVDRVEALSVIALFPLAVGAFGVYARLLNAF